MAGEAPRWPVSHCSSPRCGAPIVWARTEAGKTTPVDLEPSTLGNTELTVGTGGQPCARVVPKAERAGRTDLHTTHWVSCPARATFGARKKHAP